MTFAVRGIEKMADLIDRQDAIDTHCAICPDKDKCPDRDFVCPDRELFRMIKPAVDAVPVIRCKDCKYWDVFPSSSLAPEFHKCKELGVHTVADFFCSKGEEN